MPEFTTTIQGRLSADAEEVSIPHIDVNYIKLRIGGVPSDDLSAKPMTYLGLVKQGSPLWDSAKALVKYNLVKVTGVYSHPEAVKHGKVNFLTLGISTLELLPTDLKKPESNDGQGT